jgi:hypothetical protein
LDHFVLVNSINRFVNLRQLFFIAQQAPWKSHSHSSLIHELIHDWKPALESYHHWGASKPTPMYPRTFSFRQTLEWIAGDSDHPASTSSKPGGLERLVIASGSPGMLSPDFDPEIVCKENFSQLRYLTLDFRPHPGTTHTGGDYDWVSPALASGIRAAKNLESLDLFLGGKQVLRLEDIFDLTKTNLRLKTVALESMTFDETGLRSFLTTHWSINSLIIRFPNFDHASSWRDFVMSDGNGLRLASEPNLILFEDALFRFYQADSRISETETEEPPNPTLSNRPLGGQIYKIDDKSRIYQLEWPDGHAFAGATGLYSEFENAVEVRWPGGA